MSMTSSFSTQSSTNMKKLSKIDTVSDILISHSAISMNFGKQQLITAASSTCTKASSALLKSSESFERAYIQTSSSMEEAKLKIDS